MMDAVCGRFIIDSLVMRKCDAESKDRCYHKVAYIKRMYNTIMLGCSGGQLYCTE